MKTLISLVITVVAVVGVAAGAGAAGGPVTSPGAETGWKGIVGPKGGVRYVALTGSRETIVAAVRVRGGRILRWGVIRGGYGIPLVAFDGTTSGLSADGRTLVLAGPTANPGPVSRFPIVAVKDLRVRTTITLRGSWAYDAISPDASTLFLVEYSGTGPGASYRVRAFDVQADRLLPEPIVDRNIGEKLMRGQPVTRTVSADGRWAYTLYARQKHEPFVHALDTARRKAYCIDLPLELGQSKQMALRLRLVDGSRRLAVRAGTRVVADVDTRTFEVRTGS